MREDVAMKRGTKKMSVLLVAGGDSSERDVSLESGRCVHDALAPLGYRVVLADPARAAIEPTEDSAAFFGASAIDAEPPDLVRDPYSPRRTFVTLLGRFRELGCDVVFNCLHGGTGEDGTFQAVLDYLGIRYTGSGACASAVAMNKHVAKQLVSHAGVPVAKGIFVDSPAHESVVVDEQVRNTLSLPVVVKPNSEGSSVGVSIVRSREELGEAIRRVKRFPGPYLVESFIEGKEITASMLDHCDLPLIEIRPKAGFFDYHNKYQDGACEYLVPAPLDREATDAISASARAAYRALGCRGYARMDFRASANGSHFFLEANTLPGLTSHSLVPMAARAAGIDYTELVDMILRLSAAEPSA
jgi:D-alanine-D-alanine ligase